jgi:hypothetical protein
VQHILGANSLGQRFSIQGVVLDGILVVTFKQEKTGGGNRYQPSTNTE